MTNTNNQPSANEPSRRGMYFALVIVIIIVVGIPLLVATVAISIRRIERAEDAVARFHEQLNAGQYREIYAQSTAEFKQATSEAEFIRLVEKIRSLHGNVGEPGKAGAKRLKLSKITATAFGPSAGVYVTLQYETEYTSTQAEETFVMLTSGAQAQLFSYNVTSPSLRLLEAAESHPTTPIRFVFSGENKNAEVKTQPDGKIDLEVTAPVEIKLGTPSPNTPTAPSK